MTDQSNVEEKKHINAEFSKEEKKEAKRHYREIRKLNPAGFKNTRNQFRTVVIDRINKAKLRFNLKSVDQLN